MTPDQLRKEIEDLVPGNTHPSPVAFSYENDEESGWAWWVYVEIRSPALGSLDTITASESLYSACSTALANIRRNIAKNLWV